MEYEFLKYSFAITTVIIYTLFNHSTCKILHKNINTHYNGALMGVYLHGTDGMFYHNCSGYNFPVICEHVNFFMEMRKNGNNNIYICTKLLWDNIWN